MLGVMSPAEEGPGAVGTETLVLGGGHEATTRRWSRRRLEAGCRQIGQTIPPQGT